MKMSGKYMAKQVLEAVKKAPEEANTKEKGKAPARKLQLAEIVHHS